MQVTGLDHYNIVGTADELSRVIAFYTEVLDLTEGYRPGFGVDGAWLYAGDHALLHLTRVDKGPEHRQTGNFNHVALRCQGLDEILRRLDAREMSYQRVRVEELDVTQIFLVDPSGVRIELSFVGEK